MAVVGRKSSSTVIGATWGALPSDAAFTVKPGRGDPTRRDHAALRREQRYLAELRKVEDVVFQDAVLLPHSEIDCRY